MSNRYRGVTMGLSACLSVLLLAAVCLHQADAFGLERSERGAKPACDVANQNLLDCELTVAETLTIEAPHTFTNVKIICQTTTTCIVSEYALFMYNVKVTTTADQGAFLYLADGADLVAKKVTVKGFHAPGDNIEDGGAIFADEGSKVLLDDCTFIDNSAVQYGGALSLKGVNFAIHGCTFKNNKAPAGGGAVALIESAGAITNTEFIGNDSPQPGDRVKKWHAGGAMYLKKTDITIAECDFSDNKAGWEGAGIVAYVSTITIRKTVFAGNEAEAVACVALNDCKATLTGNTFRNNIGTEYGGAVGIWWNQAAVTLSGNTFHNNQAPAGKGPDFYCEAEALNTIFVTQHPAISDEQSWIEGPYGKGEGVCNIHRS